MNKDSFRMSDLGVGYRARVCSLSDEGRGITERLRDLGLTEGSEVECVMKSPLGDPSAYIIKGSVIALRRKDAHTVKLYSDSLFMAREKLASAKKRVREGSR